MYLGYQFPPVEYGGPVADCGSRQGYSRLGVLFPGSQVTMAQISDGTSNTLAIGERTSGETAWIAGISNRRSWPCDATGIKNIQYSINFCNEPGGESTVGNSFCWQLVNARPFGSNHPGGCHFAFCDGSVTFLSEDTDLAVLQAMSTREFGELIDDVP